MAIPEILFLLVVFVAYTFESMTGFGGTLLAMPTSILLIGINDAKTILNIIALIVGSYIAIANFKYINKKEFIKIIFFMLIGLFLGINFFEKISTNYLLNIYAVIIILIALKNIFIKKIIIKLPLIVIVIIIILAGIIQAMFLSGGALLVIYAIIALKNKSEFRATLSAVWVTLNIVLIINQARLGYVTPDILKLTSIALIPSIVAIFLGNILHKCIKQKTFIKITYIILLISGVALIIN